MPADSAIRILHLSDLHFTPERRWESDPVLGGLVGAVGDLVAAGLAPHLVAITGDSLRRRAQ